MVRRLAANLAGKSVGFKSLAKGKVTDGQKSLGYVDLGSRCREPTFFSSEYGFSGILVDNTYIGQYKNPPLLIPTL